MSVNKQHISNNRGFTIVELMISLTVLAVILLMTTVILIQINAIYNKGINAAKLQNATRTVTADVQSAIQFSGAAVSLPNSRTYGSITVNSICIGTVRYSFVSDRELGVDGGLPAPGNVTPHVLWRDNIRADASCTPLDLSQDPVKTNSDSAEWPTVYSQGYEMAPDHVRLAKFSIAALAPGSNINNVSVWMVFGDTDLLDSTTHTKCLGNTGTQFCASSNLTTVVTKRTN